MSKSNIIINSSVPGTDIKPSHKINGDIKFIFNLTQDLHQHLQIIDKCIRNLEQDFGGQSNADDYLSFASENCNKAKELLNKICKYTGTNK